MRIAVVVALLAISCTPPAPAGDAKAKTDAKAKVDAKAKTEAKNPAAKDDEPAPTTAVTPPAPKEGKTWGFEDAEDGKPAPGFKITQTGEIVTPAATWEVIADDEEAPSGVRFFGVTKSVGTNKTFNVALVEGTSYRDLEASVMLKALSGENNKGGGIVFRAKGDADYYVARWNPVENNFRLYALLAGARVDITSSPLEIDPTQWHKLVVTIKGDKIECFMDDRSIVTAIDKSLPDAGMVGLWAKGDAATLFDDLVVSGSP